MKRNWKEWLALIACSAIGAAYGSYAYFKLRLLIEIGRNVS